MRLADARRSLLPSWARLWARDSALLLLSQGLAIVATSLAAILIARNLDPDEWGVFSAFLGLGFALSILVEFGLATWLLRELSRAFADDGDAALAGARQLAGAAVCSSLAVTVAIVTIGSTTVAIHGVGTGTAFALCSLLLYGGLFASGSVLEAYLRARRRLGRVVASNMAEKYVLVVLLIAIVATGAEVWQIGAAYIAAGLLRFFILVGSVFGRTLPKVPSLSTVWSLWRKSLPFALTSGSLSVVPKFDALLLLGLSATTAGYFALGDRILGPVGVIPVVAATTLYPFLARRTHTNRAIWTLTAGFFLCGLVVAAVGFVLAPDLVTVVFGEQYEPATTAVQVMILSLPLIYASHPLLVYGFSSGHERPVFVATMAASLAGTVAIVGGQEISGVSGAAVGFFVRQALLLTAFLSIAVIASRSGRVPGPASGTTQTGAQFG